jgi:cytochrome c2
MPITLWLIIFSSCIAVALLPVSHLMQPLWDLGSRVIAVLFLSAIAFIGAAYSLRRESESRPGVGLIRIVATGFAAFMPVLLFSIVFNAKLPKISLLLIPVVGTFLLIVLFWRGGVSAARACLVAFLAIAALASQVFAVWNHSTKKTFQPQRVVSDINSSLYSLKLTSQQYVIPPPSTQAGGITTFLDRYLLASGDGDLYLFSRPEAPKLLQLQKLTHRVPLNSTAFAEAMRGVSVQLSWFRVTDVLAQSTPTGVRLFASHHFWDVNNKCFSVRVSMLEGTSQSFTSAVEKPSWQTVFNTAPCIAIVSPGRAPRFGGLEGGGRLAQFDDEHILLTVGDHAMDGWGSENKAAQDPQSSFGKVMLVNFRSGESRIFTSGHRNSQGITVGESGKVWSTEHGPQGGDELNLLSDGKNYGWPLVTYGVDYDTHAWPLAEIPGSHDSDAFQQPHMAWIPSIGISALVELSDSKFEHWRGDLLIGSLINRQLWRVRVRENRVVLMEPIPIGERIRDLVIGHQGELVMWTDRESIMFLEPAPKKLDSGAKHLFRACAACHSVPQGQDYAIGPNLVGIVGRKVASVEGFEYSAALRAFGGVWTKERLDAYLKNPAAAVPGTSMYFPGVADADSRKKLIEYLAAKDSDVTYAPKASEL